MNLNKLESKLDDALSKETTESLTNWLKNKRMNLTPAMLAHNNTHSVSRILRNIKLIREHMQDAASIKADVIELRLQKIEQACNECKEQVDQFYLITKTK